MQKSVDNPHNESINDSKIESKKIPNIDYNKKSCLEAIKRSFVNRTKNNKERIIIYLHKKAKERSIIPLISLSLVIKYLKKLEGNVDRWNLNSDITCLITEKKLKRYNCAHGKCEHSKKCDSCERDRFFKEIKRSKKKRARRTYLLITKEGRAYARWIKKDIKKSLKFFKLK